MSEVKKILEGVMVEWKFLANETYIEIANSARKPIKASLRSSGNTPYYGANNIQDYVEGKTHSGEYLLIAEDGSSSLKNYSVQYAIGDFWANNHIHVLRGINGLNTRFLFHCLQIVNFIPYLKGGERAKLTKGNLLQIQIPIPCPDNPEKSLKIQEEIVRILDSLSEETNQLTAALQKELQLHQKRYDFYREELFKFEGKEVEWKSLEELFDLKNGYTPSKQKKEYWTDGTVPWFRMEDIRRNGRVLSNSIQYVSESAVKGGKLFPANSIIIATSATIGEYALITVPYLSNQRFTNLSLKNSFTDIFIMKFMVHYSHLLGEWCKKNVTIGNFAGVDMGGFKKFPIAIPSLEEQERIVKILDDLDAKTLAITTAIKKEVALRNKQYEFYRDRLLSFSK